MKTKFFPMIKHCLPKAAQWRLCGFAALALVVTGCVSPSGPPGPKDLQANASSRRAVVLLRVVTEVDGQTSLAFSHVMPADCIWLGLGDFSSGGKVKPAPLRFLSKETRLDGWTYLDLEPGIYYFAPHPPIFQDTSTYDNSWSKLPPIWQLEVPRNAPVIYAGTLFVPGKGRWMLLGPRSLVRFDEQRFEIRNETSLAEAIWRTWLQNLGTLTVKLVEPHSPGEPIILDTPPGR